MRLERTDFELTLLSDSTLLVDFDVEMVLDISLVVPGIRVRLAVMLLFELVSVVALFLFVSMYGRPSDLCFFLLVSRLSQELILKRLSSLNLNLHYHRVAALPRLSPR